MSSPSKHYSFLDVYASILTKIQDRKNLDSLKLNDEFLFYQKMYNYMFDGISEYTNPTSIYPILADRINSEYKDKEYVLSSTNSFVLDEDLLPDDNSIIRCKVDDSIVEYSYDSATKTITVINPPFQPYTVLLEKYIIGKFNQGLTDRQLSILSAHSVYIWALQVSNNEEDITRLMLDTDFKMASEATVTKAKVDWVNSYREKANALMNSNDWGNIFLDSGLDNRSPAIY